VLLIIYSFVDVLVDLSFFGVLGVCTPKNFQKFVCFRFLIEESDCNNVKRVKANLDKRIKRFLVQNDGG
jgi:hypothetical protein